MKNKIITILMAILFLSILTTIVYGAEPQITIDGDETVKVGETKEVKVKISSEEEIGIISGKIESNADITGMEVTGINNWNLTYNNSTGAFNIYKAEGAKEQEIIKISYTVGTEEGTGTITLSELKLTTINYTTEEIDNVTKEITITKEVTPEPTTEKSLTSIVIEKEPTKKVYTVGENFDKTGMKVMATYSDGSSKEITNYVIKDGEKLEEGKTLITIGYTEGTKTVTTTQKITVNKANTSGTTADKSTGGDKQDTTQTGSKIPYTGVYDVVIMIGITTVLTIVFYLRYKKYKQI